MSDTDNLDGLFAELKSVNERSEEIAARAKEAQEDHTEILAELKERIKSGETTGDPLKDFLLVAYGEPSSECEQAFRDLNKRVRDHQGEFVLVISRREEPTVNAGPGYVHQPHEYRLDETYKLGVIRGPLQFDLRGSDWKFDTGSHIRAWDGGRKLGHQQEQEDLEVFMSSFFYIGLEKVAAQHGNHWRYDLTGGPPTELSIFVGHDEIEAWLKPTKFEEQGFEVVPEESGQLTERAKIFLKMVRAGGWNSMTGKMAYLGERMSERADVVGKAIEELDDKRKALLMSIEKATHDSEVVRLHSELRDVKRQLSARLEEAKELNVIDEDVVALWRDLDLS